MPETQGLLLGGTSWSRPQHNIGPWSQSGQRSFRKPAGQFQQQLCDLVRKLSFNAGFLLSGRNTCVKFAPVAMASAKCSAEVTSVRVYARKADLKILFLWGGEINILSKCWKWDGPLHVSKQNPRDKVSVTASLTSLRFISISGP